MTPVGAIVRGLAAGAAGTTAMDAAQYLAKVLARPGLKQAA